MDSIGGVSGIGAPLPPNRIGGDEFIRYVGDRLILDFHEGGGTTVRDLSGNGNNGTLTNTDDLTWGKDRLNFGGINGYVETSPFGFDYNYVSFEFQIYPLYLGDRHTLLGQSESDYLPQVEVGTAQLGANRVGTMVPHLWEVRTDNYVIDTNGWYHIVATKNGGGIAPKIYADGVQKPVEVTNLLTYYTTVVSKQIGQRNDSQYFNGFISFVRINATVLSALQIQNEYLWNKFRS